MYPSRRTISSLLPRTNLNRVVLVDEQDVDDIIDAVETRHQKYAANYDKISQLFWKGSAHKTAEALFNFLKANVKYKIESDKDQTVRSPEALIAMGYGDCKHYAAFITGVLASLRRKGYPIGPVMYRFSGYNPLADDLHHVFAVLKDGNQEVWIDPVLNTFNDKKQYSYYQNSTVGHMLSEISGIPGEGVGNIFDDIKKGFNNTVKKVESKVQQAAHDVQQGAKNTVTQVQRGAQNTVQKSTKAAAQQVHAQQVNAQNLKKGFVITKSNVQKGADNTVQKVKKVVLETNPLTVAGRNAFLALLKMNAFNIAHRLYDFIHTSKANENELRAKWESIGGNYSNLENNINQGIDAYVKRMNMTRAGYNQQQAFMNGYAEEFVFPYYIGGMSDASYGRVMGLDPITISALMTAAATVIAILSPILSKAKWSKQDQQNATAAIQSGAQTISNAAAATGDGYFATGLTTLPDGSVVSTVQGQVYTDPTGTAYVQPYTPNFDYSDPQDYQVVDANGNMPTAITDDLSNFWRDIKLFFTVNKKPLMITGALVVAWKLGVFKSTHKVTKRGK